MRRLIILAILILSTSAIAADDLRDGNWWSQLDSNVKLIYVTGFFNGINLGNYFSVWGVAPDGKPFVPEGPGANLVYKSYAAMFEKYLKGVSSGQLVDGITEFYKDFRNRKIRIHAAAWLVLNQIAGTPSATIDSMVESWRRNPQ